MILLPGAKNVCLCWRRRGGPWQNTKSWMSAASTWRCCAGARDADPGAARHAADRSGGALPGPAGTARRGDRAVASRLRRFAAAARFRHGVRPRASVSGPAGGAAARARHAAGFLVRRLAGGGDRRRVLPPDRAAGPGGRRSASSSATARRRTSSTSSTRTPTKWCGEAGTIRRASAPDYNAWEDDALVRYARGREALSLYGFQPYMYNPQLRRWLARHRGADAGAVGRGGSHGHAGVRPRLCRS